MLVLFLALFAGVIAGRDTLYERDLDAIHRPLRTLLVRLWHETGGPPPWNPLLDMGQPFAANPQAAVYHPLSWLFLFLPFEAAFKLQVLLPLLASFAGMVALVRVLHGSRPAAALAAGSWAFGGLQLSLTNLLPMLLTLAPVPATLAFALRLVRAGRRRDALGLAVGVALTCAGGEPMSLLAALLLLAAAIAGELLGHPQRRPRAAANGVARTVVASVLGVALAAAVLLPSLGLAARSVRGAGLPLARSEIWSLPPIRLVELVIPHAMGHTDVVGDAAYWGAAAYPTKRFPLIYSLYPGLIVSALALASLARPRAARAVWAGAALLGFLAAAGSHAPIWSILRHAAPAAVSPRFPEKLAAVTGFALCVLAAFGFDDVAAGRRRARKLATTVLGAAAALSAVGWVLAASAPSAWSSRLMARLGAPASAGDLARLFPTDCAVVVGLAGAYWLGLRALTRQGPVRGGTWVAALLALDLFIAGKPLVPSRPPTRVDPAMAPLRPLARASPPARVFNLAAWRPKDPVVGSAPSDLEAAGAGIGTAFGSDVDLSELAWSGRAGRLFWKAIRSDPQVMAPALLRRGVGGVLTHRPHDPTEGVTRRPAPILVSLGNPQPDVFCVDRVVPFDGDDGWIAAARALGVSQVSAALVEGADALLLPQRPAPCRAEVLLRTPVHLRVGVDASGPGESVLAVNQTWDDRWSVSVDGSSARLWRTDISLSAVDVPPGRHEIELTYRDRAAGYGLAISAAACLLALATAAHGVWRHRRS